ncbi:MAG: AAA family ATPase [Rhodoglobus sp.]
MALKPQKRTSTTARKVKLYRPEDVRTAFRSYYAGDESNGEQPMFCPICEDPDASHSPSASMKIEEGLWYCFGKCGGGGPITDLVAELKSRPGFSMSGRVHERHRPSAKPKSTLPPLLDESLEQKAVQDWPAMLAHKPDGDVWKFLTQQRGLTDATIQFYKLGIDGAGNLTIPIRFGLTKFRNVRYRRMQGGTRNRYFSHPGHGSPPVLYPTAALASNSFPVLVTESELCAILANQIGEGQFVAVSGTGGSENVPTDVTALVHREVFLAYDNDEVGQKGQKKLAARLAEAGNTRVYSLDWAALGLPKDNKGLKDFTDWIMKCGGNAEQLVAEMERMRQESPTERDDIDEAMEAAFLELRDSRRHYTAALVSEEEILARPPLSYVVEPFVPRGMLTVLFGAPGSGKTFGLQDLVNHVRAGMAWHGHAVERGGALLLEAEGLEQLQPRILAWNEHHKAAELNLAPFRALEDPFDLSSPEGAGALVRTVLGMQTFTGQKVELIGADPAALYMASSENEDGNRNLALGLNAVAKYLNIGVVLIVHTNASGERARGTDHLRMLSGSYVRVEKLDGGRVGIVQEKVKNTYPHAVILNMEPVGASVVLTSSERMSAAEYEVRKSMGHRETRAAYKVSDAQAERAVKDDLATTLLLDAVRTQPGIVQGKLLAACKGRGIGNDPLGAVLDNLVNVQKRIRVETTGAGKQAPRRHYLADSEGTVNREPHTHTGTHGPGGSVIPNRDTPLGVRSGSVHDQAESTTDSRPDEVSSDTSQPRPVGSTEIRWQPPIELENDK